MRLGITASELTLPGRPVVAQFQEISPLASSWEILVSKDLARTITLPGQSSCWLTPDASPMGLTVQAEPLLARPDYTTRGLRTGFHPRAQPGVDVST